MTTSGYCCISLTSNRCWLISDLLGGIDSECNEPPLLPRSNKSSTIDRFQGDFSNHHLGYAGSSEHSSASYAGHDRLNDRCLDILLKEGYEPQSARAALRAVDNDLEKARRVLKVFVLKSWLHTNKCAALTDGWMMWLCSQVWTVYSICCCTDSQCGSSSQWCSNITTPGLRDKPTFGETDGSSTL